MSKPIFTVELPTVAELREAGYDGNPEDLIPTKAAPETNTGYDIILVKKNKDIEHDPSGRMQCGIKTQMYDTMIKIKPADGYYTEIYPRSSIHKLPYRIANSVGIIDNPYRGTLRVCIDKMGLTIPDLELPCKLFQLVIRKNHEAEFVVGNVDETERGEGGFGSTN